MKSLVCANQKGGVGKTTIIVHLAFYFAELGKKVVVVDIDHQMNASFSLSKYSIEVSSSKILYEPNENYNSVCSSLVERKKSFDNKYSNIYLIPADPELLALDKLNPESLGNNLFQLFYIFKTCGVDIILIDTPPALVPRLAAALMVADTVISPIELEVYSIQGIALMFKTIRSIRDLKNKKLRFLGMLPNRVDNRNPRHKAHLKELKSAYPDLVLPLEICLRGSIADAVSQKMPVWDIKKTAARPAGKEMKALGQYILNQFEG